MNATTVLAAAFLQGRVLSIMTAFKDFSITNLPREASRLIEKPFGVKLTRVKRLFQSKYGIPGYYFEYRLPDTPYNAEGRQKMIEYVEKNRHKPSEIKTDKQANAYKQLNLL